MFGIFCVTERLKGALKGSERPVRWGSLLLRGAGWLGSYQPYVTADDSRVMGARLVDVQLPWAPGSGDRMHSPAPRTLALRTTGITYPGTPEKVSAARADLRSLLESCPMADDVLVCASELATNAVLHSQSRLADGAFTVRGKISPGSYVWIEVEDDGGPWSPAACDPERGHGLDIIRALTDDWGIDGDHAGRTVWARFDWPSS